MDINLGELARFLVAAKKKTYAGDGKETRAQRPGFRELEFRKGDWYYRDSYAGFFFAPGQEVVRYKGSPVWAMAYSGGMKKEYHGDAEFAAYVFGFLKKALGRVSAARPFRGPGRLKVGDFLYVDKSRGDIRDFSGEERIFYKGKEVFRQYYIGGMIKSK
jgi:hypothetical protein